MARAIATRWRSPPESCSGRWCARSARPTAASASAARSPALRRRHPGEHHRQLDVARRGQPRHQVEELEDEADVVPPDGGELGVGQRLRPRDPRRRSARWSGRSRQPSDVEQRRLARSRRTHDRHVLAGGDALGDVDEGEDRLLADDERARDAVEPDHRWRFPEKRAGTSPAPTPEAMRRRRMTVPTNAVIRTVPLRALLSAPDVGAGLAPAPTARVAVAQRDRLWDLPSAPDVGAGLAPARPAGLTASPAPRRPSPPPRRPRGRATAPPARPRATRTSPR